MQWLLMYDACMPHLDVPAPAPQSRPKARVRECVCVCVCVRAQHCERRFLYLVLPCRTPLLDQGLCRRLRQPRLDGALL
eukprot:1515111-Alexandrium_andersonii.AAC.1